MNRRDFLGATITQATLLAAERAGATGLWPHTAPAALKPMAIGLIISPAKAPEETIQKVHALGMSNCFLSLDGYIGNFTAERAQELKNLLGKYEIIPTCAEVVGPGRLAWDFLDGPSTIGLVPPATRTARMDALKQTSDFAKQLNIPRVQTHCGFIPENPRDPLYEPTVLAIRELAEHCAANGQEFLMETGQETPTTMARAIKDVDRPNLGVGLDTANLILYGKANPVDAIDIIGPHVRSVHAKDGKWPTDPMKLGEEVLIGTGIVDFTKVLTKLHKLGYRNPITIERETSGPQQLEDVKQEKIYLEKIIASVQTEQA
jgi:L-ribulose-5-phosphate 3-epimerase